MSRTKLLYKCGYEVHVYCGDLSFLMHEIPIGIEKFMGQFANKSIMTFYSSLLFEDGAKKFLIALEIFK